MAHANFEFGESNGRCNHCDSRTVLVSFYGDVSVDSEPFGPGEQAEDSAEAKIGIEIPEVLEVDDELTGHYCLKCERLTTLCLNTPPRQRFTEIDPEIEARLFEQRMSDRGINATVKINESTL